MPRRRMSVFHASDGPLRPMLHRFDFSSACCKVVCIIYVNHKSNQWSLILIVACCLLPSDYTGVMRDIVNFSSNASFFWNARFLLTIASRGPSAIAELLVLHYVSRDTNLAATKIADHCMWNFMF